MKFIYILLFISCGKIPTDFIKKEPAKDPRKFHTIGLEFEFYYTEFEAVCNTKPNIPIGFSALENRLAGVCYFWDSGAKEIHIEPDYWQGSSESYKLWLVFHELGHCHLGLDHNNKYREDGTPESIMIDSIPYNVDKLLKEQIDYYFEELCNNTKQ